jgi:hypothetical protein
MSLCWFIIFFKLIVDGAIYIYIKKGRKVLLHADICINVDAYMLQKRKESTK